eukprot:gene7617-772_t
MVSLLRLSLAAFVLVVTILVSAKDESDITCNQSGMCSLGKTEYFYGSIQTNEGFKDALKKVSYKNEVILVTTYGSYFLEFVFQLHNQFRRLGMSHFLALSMKEEGCQEVVQVGRADKKISCAWDDSPQHSNSWEGGPLLSHLRWRFLARAARIGYNVALSSPRSQDWLQRDVLGQVALSSPRSQDWLQRDVLGQVALSSPRSQDWLQRDVLGQVAVSSPPSQDWLQRDVLGQVAVSSPRSQDWLHRDVLGQVAVSSPRSQDWLHRDVLGQIYSWAGGLLLSHLRWRFLARAARIGNNVMSLDSDYMVLQDPYVF